MALTLLSHDCEYFEGQKTHLTNTSFFGFISAKEIRQPREPTEQWVRTAAEHFIPAK
jgi:hypothetical protein